MSQTQAAPLSAKPLTDNFQLTNWINDLAQMTRPDRVVWCDGSMEERKRLTEECLQNGVLQKLNDKKWPNCFLHRSNPNDVARVEHLTFICSRTREAAGPTNNW